jgi:hypothetical protein
MLPLMKKFVIYSNKLNLFVHIPIKLILSLFNGDLISNVI